MRKNINGRKRKVCVVITARPSYSRIKMALEAIRAHPDLALQLVVAASALLERFGTAIEYIERDGFEINARVYMVLEGENPASMAKTTGLGLIELATVFDNLRPDVVVTIADRYETIATAVAASYMNIPLAHVQGGEVTGSIDEKVRHASNTLLLQNYPPEPEFTYCYRGQPGAVLARPRPGRPFVVDLTAQQEPADAVPGAREIMADVLAAAHEITQLLALDRRDRDQHQLAGGQQPRQVDRVALIGLDPVLRRPLGLARCAHPKLDPLRPRPAREPVPSRARLIDHPRRPLNPTKPRQQLVRTTDHSLADHLTRVLIEDRERRLARVHVQTDPTDTVRHRRSSRRLCGPRAEGAILSAKTYPAACAGSAEPFDTPKAGPPYRQSTGPATDNRRVNAIVGPVQHNRLEGDVMAHHRSPDAPRCDAAYVEYLPPPRRCRSWRRQKRCRCPGTKTRRLLNHPVLENRGEFFLGALQRSKACAGIVHGQRRGHQATAGQARCLDDRLLPRF